MPSSVITGPGIMSAHIDELNSTFLTPVKKDLEHPLCVRFEEQVRKYAHHYAVRTRNAALTYDALNQNANRIARAIVDRCGIEQQRIAQLVADDAQNIATTLGILKAGKTYVALDPNHPPARNQQVWSHAQAALIVTDSENVEAARTLFGAGETLNIDTISSSVSAENLGLAIPPDAPAGILYTSGSTGQPKGVLQSQRNLLRWGLSNGYPLRISPADRVCVISSRTSGQSMVGILGALLYGAAVCPFRFREEGPNLLSAWLVEEEITIYHSSPSIFRSLIQVLSGHERFPRLRAVRLGGEMASAQDLELCKKHFSSRCVFVNGLGATEVGPFREFVADHHTTINGSGVPAGYPVLEADVLLLDHEGREVETGCVGEIAVRSDYLAVSYWREPELTDAAFRPDPAGSGARVYRTGDIGRLSADGCLYYLGRQGRQVKIRGNRVEPAEVEMTLRTVEGVRDAAVTMRQNNQGEPFLVAYVVAAIKPGPSIASLRASLYRLLPEYMVPPVFVMLDSLPMTSHGKVDLKALPEPKLERAYVAPRNSVETLICELWEQILGVRPVGIRDDFLELGGNSLLATRLMTHMELHFGKKIPHSTLLSATTVEELAKIIPAQEDGERSSPLVQIQAGDDSRKPFVLLHGQYNGWGFYCRALAPLLGEHQPFYVLHPLPPGDDLPATVELMAERYIRELRKFQPHGPYLLGGYCNSGFIAFEMAQELRNQGEEVELLVLIESVARNYEFREHRKFASRAARLLKLSPADELECFIRLCGVSGRLRGLSRWQKVKFLVRKVNALPGVARSMKRRLWQRLRPNATPLHLASATAPPDGWNQAKLDAHYRRLIRGYVPRPYSGRLTIFRARDEKHLTDDPTLGWRSLTQDVDPHMIPGDHHGCITLAENLSVLAGHLVTCLDACHVASHQRYKKQGAGQ